ncbi:MAG TPA: hypothetical protein VI113_04480 [Alphaproteobacteria bacterium]
MNRLCALLLLALLSACEWEEKIFERPALPRADAPLPPQDGPRADAVLEVAPPPPNPAFLTGAPEAEAPIALADGSPASTLAEPSLDWHATLQDDVIAVEFIDATSRYRVESVELVGPNGARIPSAPLTRAVDRNFGYSTDVPPGTFVIGVFGGSSGLDGNLHGGLHGDIGRGFDNRPLGIRDTGVPSKTTTRARIMLPDPAAYRADVKKWKIAIELLDSNGETSHFALPAPAP